MGKLTAVGVQNLKKPGRYYDGGNLALEVGPGGGKSWCFMFMREHRTRQMGLGPYPTVSLAKARERALEYRLVLIEGGDPFAVRDAKRAERRGITFEECAEAYIEAHKAGWKKPKHAKLWQSTLDVHAAALGKLSVRSITNNDVLKVLAPIWETLPETAGRVRGRIETVLAWAKVKGYRDGENPAAWKGNLDHLLPPRGKVARVRHHPALPFSELPAFLSELSELPGKVAPLAFRFMILTASRTSEVTGARWSEISFKDKLWTIPAERMKADREHRVPLSPQAMAILQSLKPEKIEPTNFIFAGARGGALSNMAFLACLKRMERTDITPHGMRSTFRDWVSERTDFSGEVAEMALSHVIPSKVESAYRRGDLLAKRRTLMEAWGTFCDTATVAVLRVA